MNESILRVLESFGLDDAILKRGQLRNREGFFKIDRDSNKFCLDASLGDEKSSVSLIFDGDELQEMDILNDLVFSKNRGIKYTLIVNKDNFIEIYMDQHFSKTKFESYHLKYNPKKPSEKETVLLFDRGDNLGMADEFNITYDPNNDSYITSRKRRRAKKKKKSDKQVRMVFGSDGEIMTQTIFNLDVVQRILRECVSSTKNLNEDLWNFCEDEFPWVRDYTEISKGLRK